MNGESVIPRFFNCLNMIRCNVSSSDLKSFFDCANATIRSSALVVLPIAETTIKKLIRRKLF